MNDKQNTQEILNVRIELRGEMLKKFLELQSHLGIESATEIMRYLINDFYRNNIEPKHEIKASGNKHRSTHGSDTLVCPGSFK